MPQESSSIRPDFKTETVFSAKLVIRDGVELLVINEGREGFQQVFLFQATEQFKVFAAHVAEQAKELNSG